MTITHEFLSIPEAAQLLRIGERTTYKLVRGGGLTRANVGGLGSEASPEDRWRAGEYDAVGSRAIDSLDMFWLKDDSLLDADNLPDPDVIAEEIAEDLRSALEQIEEILGDLQVGAAK